jgi:hypothetical protein
MADELLETHVFIVRLWKERRDIPDAPDLWRGRAENIATGEIRYFRTAAELAAHLLAQTGAPAAED